MKRLHAETNARSALHPIYPYWSLPDYVRGIIMTMLLPDEDDDGGENWTKHECTAVRNLALTCHAMLELLTVQLRMFRTIDWCCHCDTQQAHTVALDGATRCVPYEKRSGTKNPSRAYLCTKCTKKVCDECGYGGCRCDIKLDFWWDYCGGCDRVLCKHCFGDTGGDDCIQCAERCHDSDDDGPHSDSDNESY